MKKQLKPIALDRILLTDGILGQRQVINRKVTVPVIMEKHWTGQGDSPSVGWTGKDAPSSLLGF